eukprot:scaffold537_cov241-Pinguiococcus_pyrenoidosus.AAC.22
MSNDAADEAAAPKETEAIAAELRGQVAELEAALKESSSRRYGAQHECDSTRTMLEQVRAEIQEMDKGLERADLRQEESERSHRMEKEVYEHKICHLKYQHEMLLAVLEDELNTDLKSEAEGHAQRREALLERIRGLRAQYAALETDKEVEVRRIDEQFDKLYKRRQQELFDQRIGDLCRRLDKRLEEWKEKTLFRTKLDVYELTERKNEHIRTLTENHQHAFEQMKEYYTSITKGNIDLINEYRTTLETTRKRIAHVREEAKTVSVENEALRQPLAQTLAQQQGLANQLLLREKDLASLEFAKQRLKKGRSRQARLVKERDELKIQLDRCKQGIQAMEEAFEDAIQQIRERNAATDELMQDFEATQTNFDGLKGVFREGIQHMRSKEEAAQMHMSDLVPETEEL